MSTTAPAKSSKGKVNSRRARFHSPAHRQEIKKSSTGIKGLDEITGGGLPAGRPTLVCGSAGCGKTLMAMEFLVRGATQFNEPGIFMAFEETPRELVENVRSLGFDLDQLSREGRLYLEHVHVDAAEIQETGDYDLEGLFIRLGAAIDSIGAKRIVLDTIETLFGGLTNAAILRSELRRLFSWLKDKGVTAIITAERGDGTLTRQGLEEYVSDCVILLDHRVNDQISTRRLRIVKYRGSNHGNNEYPFLIDENGIDVLPVTSLSLSHPAGNDRISTGVPRLDSMLGGEGVYRGSTVLVSGSAGTGKTTLAATLADASCRRGERCLYFAFEESPTQIIRNMASVGLKLQPWVDKDLLTFVATRPVMHGLESHLAIMHKAIREYQPELVIIDPISDLCAVGSLRDVKNLLVRLVDFLKSRQITAVMLNLNQGGQAEETDVGISSVVDTWFLLRDIELDGERNRGMYILKSRGSNHSNQIREFLLTSHGIELRDVYIGPEGVLTGSARLSQELREQAATKIREADIARQQRDLERKRVMLEAQIAALKLEFDATHDESSIISQQEDRRESALESNRQRMAQSRRADAAAASAARPSNGSISSRKGRRS